MTIPFLKRIVKKIAAKICNSGPEVNERLHNICLETLRELPLEHAAKLISFMDDIVREFQKEIF